MTGRRQQHSFGTLKRAFFVACAEFILPTRPFFTLSSSEWNDLMVFQLLQDIFLSIFCLMTCIPTDNCNEAPLISYFPKLT